MWSKSLTTELQQEERTQSDKMLQWEFGAEKEKCMSIEMKLTERPSLVHKGLDFLLQDINYVPHWGGVQKLVAKDESHSNPTKEDTHSSMDEEWPQEWLADAELEKRNSQADTSNRRHKDAQKIRHTGTMDFQESQVFEVCPSNGEETQPGMEISPQQKLFVLSKLTIMRHNSRRPT